MKHTFKLTARTLSIYVLCGVLFYACRKELVKNDELSTVANGITLEEAKSYYAALIKREGDELKLESVIGNRALNTMASSFPKHNKKYAQFQSALAYETEKSSVVEVPINFDQKVSSIRISKNANLSQEDKKLMFEHSFTRLVVYKSKKTGTIRHLLLN